jgi:16S rRNA processing protein RimM
MMMAARQQHRDGSKSIHDPDGSIPIHDPDGSTSVRDPDGSTSMLCLGVIGGARGLKGEVRVSSYTADPADIAVYGPLYDDAGAEPLSIRITGRSRNQVVARVDGVDDRTAAEALNGRRLCVRRDALPEPDEDEFYHADLVGLRAERADGKTLGTVRGVHDFGAGNMLEIANPLGEVVVVPFTRAIVPEVDPAGGRVVIDPPPGLLEPGEPEPATEGSGKA